MSQVYGVFLIMLGVGVLIASARPLALNPSVRAAGTLLLASAALVVAGVVLFTRGGAE